MKLDNIELDTDLPFGLKMLPDSELRAARSRLLSLDDWNKPGVSVDFYYIRYNDYYYLGDYSISLPKGFEFSTLVTNRRGDILLITPQKEKGFLIDSNRNIKKESKLEISLGSDWMLQEAKQIIEVE